MLNTKYSHILTSEKFKEFLALVNQNIPINLKEWTKTFGFKNSTYFIGFLRRRNIKYKVSSVFENLSKELKDQITFDYKDGLLTVRQILAKYKISDETFYKIVGRNEGNRDRRKYGNVILAKINHNVEVTDTIFGQMKNILDKNNIRYIIGKNKNHSLYFKLDCQECGKSVKIRTKDFDRAKADPKIKCYECFVKNHASSVYAAKPLDKQRNTTGYIGVFVRKKREKPLGYETKIMYGKVKEIRKYFSDQTLSDKTLIEAAVHREKYILENNLPHTRNFSDMELISNMEMLGEYSEIEKIKSILNKG